jgi:hypothetical protein
MSLTRIQATDEMLALVKYAWETTAGQPGSRLKWENVGSASVPPTGQSPWARVIVRHTTAGQSTLAGASGTRLFRRNGIIIVQLFEVKGKGVIGTVDLAKIIMDAYEGVTTVGGVEFRDVTINEVGPEGDFFQENIVIPFSYYECK